METTLQRTVSGHRVVPEACCEQSVEAIDLESAIIFAGCQLKRVVCSRLVGEISDSQYDAQRFRLLEQYGSLTQARGGLGYAWQAFADEADLVEVE